MDVVLTTESNIGDNYAFDEHRDRSFVRKVLFAMPHPDSCGQVPQGLCDQLEGRIN